MVVYQVPSISLIISDPSEDKQTSTQFWLMSKIEKLISETLHRYLSLGDIAP